MLHKYTLMGIVAPSSPWWHIDTTTPDQQALPREHARGLGPPIAERGHRVTATISGDARARPLLSSSAAVSPFDGTAVIRAAAASARASRSASARSGASSPICSLICPCARRAAAHGATCAATAVRAMGAGGALVEPYGQDLCRARC